MSVDEYQVAHLWSVARQSKNETGGGEGVEFLQNEPFFEETTGKEGQYTYKKISKDSRVPAWIRMIAPEGSLDVYERSWNCYPEYKTIITNGYLKENFHITIKTRHLPFNGTFEDPHNIQGTETVMIDIANDTVDDSTVPDPSKFVSKKTGRGGLGEHWISESIERKTPLMCCYKLVEVELKSYMFIERKLEQIILAKCRQIITVFMRQLFCWIDEWYGLTLHDIRKVEEQTKSELNELYAQGTHRGMSLENGK